MKKSMIEKLKKHTGETIAEVLIALLISTIGLLMLATMISSSGNSISRSRTLLENYYSASTETSETAQVTVKNKTVDKTYTYSVKTDSKSLGGKTVIAYSDGSLISAGGTP